MLVLPWSVVLSGSHLRGIRTTEDLSLSLSLVKTINLVARFPNDVRLNANSPNPKSGGDSHRITLRRC